MTNLSLSDIGSSIKSKSVLLPYATTLSQSRKIFHKFAPREGEKIVLFTLDDTANVSKEKKGVTSVTPWLER